MHREAGGRGQGDDEDEELNTGQNPAVAANASIAPQVDTSKAASPPQPDDTTPLLTAASPRRAYHAVPLRVAADDLQRSLQHPPPMILEEEEENQLTASLPSSLGHNSLHVETTPVRKEEGIFSLTDAGDDDETFQAKLFAVRKEARHRRKLKRTISSALGITEDVSVALLGNPNLAEACHHSPTPSRSDTPTPSDTPPTAQGVFVA